MIARREHDRGFSLRMERERRLARRVARLGEGLRLRDLYNYQTRRRCLALVGRGRDDFRGWFRDLNEVESWLERTAHDRGAEQRQGSSR